jgi:hypothetical protein
MDAHCWLVSISSPHPITALSPDTLVIRELRKRYNRLCGLVVRVLDYRSRGPGSIPGTTRFSGGEKKGKQVMGLERGPLSLVSTTEELLDRKVAAPV